ncbi:carboxymuconolactone decarboxylase family protein [soil metagenome]
MPEPWSIGGAAALQQHAPTAAAALTGLVALWPDSLGESVLGTIRTVSAEGIGLTPLRLPPTGPRRAGVSPQPEVMAFAEQFAVDVSAIDPEVRAGWVQLLGRASFDGALAVYVADYVPRVRAVLDRLFGPEGWFDVDLVLSPHAGDLMDAFIQEVALLDALDPVTTELVRLRGARQHGCRVCMSRRSLAAVRDGADATMFQEVDDYRHSGLTDAHQAALALTDAIIWTPADLRERDIEAVRSHLAPAAALEVVLDVMRNATNKIAVALGADAPEHEGVQLFELDDAGRLSFP